MSPDERDRLTKVETVVEMQRMQLNSMNQKLDQLIAAANMGKGAWWLILRIGAVVATIAGFFAWIFDKIPHK